MTCQYNGRLAGLILASGPLSHQEYLTNWYFMIPEFYWHRRIGRAVGYEIHAGTGLREEKVFRNHDSQVTNHVSPVTLRSRSGQASHDSPLCLAGQASLPTCALSRPQARDPTVSFQRV